MNSIVRKAINICFIAFTVFLVMGGLFDSQNALAQHPVARYNISRLAHLAVDRISDCIAISLFCGCNPNLACRLSVAPETDRDEKSSESIRHRTDSHFVVVVASQGYRPHYRSFSHHASFDACRHFYNDCFYLGVNADY